MEHPRKGGRVLVVDDDAPLRETAARFLRRAGHFVVTADDAEVALAQTELGRAAFDVIVTDVHLPAMSGIELTSILLERRPTQRVIVVTGDSDASLARDALSLGPVTYLLKPFELFELESAVNSALVMPHYAPAPPEVSREKRPATIGTVPAEWLLWVDDRSLAGAGHGDRVARMARIVALALTPPFKATPLAELEVAAWSHEIGLLAGVSTSPVELAWRSAEMLMECGSTDGVVSAVRHMHERWDGTGGPDRLREYQVPGSAQVLAAVDTIDHYCASWIQSGMDPDAAADRAIGLVAAQKGTVFNPEIARALTETRESLRSIAGVRRRAPLTTTTRKPVRALPFDVTATETATVVY